MVRCHRGFDTSIEAVCEEVSINSMTDSEKDRERTNREVKRDSAEVCGRG